jgi:hypothetical protein
MSVDQASVDGLTSGDGETMAAVDEIDGQTHFVIADVGREGAWVAVAERVAVPADR